MEKGSLSVGEPVRIEYHTDPGDDGTIGLHITKPPLLMIYWQNGPSPIVGGLLYDVTAPGMNQPGDYTVTASVTLKDGSTIAGTTTFKVTETTTAAVDFSISLSPAVLTLAKGSSGVATLTVSERHPNKATWPLNLNVEGAPLGVSVTFAPNPVEPPAGGQATSRVFVRASDSAMPGNYSLDITAVGGVCAPETPGGQSICIDFMPKHTTLVLIIQSSAPSQFGSLGPLLSALRSFWVAIAAGSLVVLLVGAALLARRRKRPSLTLRFCIECGVKMKTSDPYCPKCGAKQPT